MGEVPIFFGSDLLPKPANLMYEEGVYNFKDAIVGANSMDGLLAYEKEKIP